MKIKIILYAKLSGDPFGSIETLFKVNKLYSIDIIFEKLY